MAKTMTAKGKPATAAQRAALRSLTSVLAERLGFASQHGVTFEGKRDLYDACGYDRTLDPAKYWARYKRNGVARRLVNALPSATWRTGAELVEDDDPYVVTPFEQAWLSLAERLDVWNRMRKTDTLAQLGRYSVILIGAPGALTEELKRMSGPGEVAYLKHYGERDVEVKAEDLVGYPFTGREADANSPRFGKPKLYTFKRLAGSTVGGGSIGGVTKKVHWSRVIHVADEAIEDDLYGEPKLASVWNWLDDLEKVTGSGSEAFWRRVQPMLQAKLQPGVTLQTPAEVEIETEIDELVHGLRRWARTTGIDIA